MTTRHAQPCRCADCIDGENRLVRPAAIASAAPSSLTESPYAWVLQDSREAIPGIQDAPRTVGYIPPEALWPEGVPAHFTITPLYEHPAQAPAIQAPEAVAWGIRRKGYREPHMITLVKSVAEGDMQKHEQYAKLTGRDTPYELVSLVDSTPSAAVSAAEPVADGERWIKVNGTFDALVMSMDRADRKGYMPDALADEWEKFDWVEAPALAPTQPQQGTGSGK